VPTRRQVLSDVPPAAKPVTIFSVSIWAWAQACWPMLASSAAAPVDWMRWRRWMLMSVS